VESVVSQSGRNVGLCLPKRRSYKRDKALFILPCRLAAAREQRFGATWQCRWDGTDVSDPTATIVRNFDDAKSARDFYGNRDSCSLVTTGDWQEPGTVSHQIFGNEC
jgi:hypothetical protein